MSWAIGFDQRWQRDIGYGVPATCDFPNCNADIDRGLSYVCCGEQPYGDGDGFKGCGLYFCEKHHPYFKHGVGGWCYRCFRNLKPFEPKPERQSWLNFKLTDESWEKWRAENGIAETQPPARTRSPKEGQ